MEKSKIIPVNTPLLDIHEKRNVIECLKTNQLTSGKFIKKFEKSFSSFHSKKYGISVSNGTAALEVAIKSLELKKGSEVIIPNFSIISTALSVIKNGLKPVYVDCDLKTWNTTDEAVISKISKKHWAQRYTVYQIQTIPLMRRHLSMMRGNKWQKLW